MLSRIEMKYYKDITRIADSLERIADLLQDSQRQKIIEKSFEEEFNDDEYKKIGERIKQKLEEKGMSQRELAQACKITEVSMSRYISGSRVAKGPLYALMARVLGCSVEWLLGGEKDEQGH